MHTLSRAPRARAGIPFLALVMLASFIAQQAQAAAVITFETTPTGAIPVDEMPLPNATPYIMGGVQVQFWFDNGAISDALFERIGGDQFDIPGFQGSSG